MTYRLVRQGGSVVEIPVAFVDRQAGESKMSLPIVVEAFTLVTGWGLRDMLTGRAPPAHPPGPATRCTRHGGLSLVPAAARTQVGGAHHPPRGHGRLLRVGASCCAARSCGACRWWSAAPASVGWWRRRRTRPAATACTRRCRRAWPAAGAPRPCSSPATTRATARSARQVHEIFRRCTPLVEPIVARRGLPRRHRRPPPARPGEAIGAHDPAPGRSTSSSLVVQRRRGADEVPRQAGLARRPSRGASPSGSRAGPGRRGGAAGGGAGLPPPDAGASAVGGGTGDARPAAAPRRGDGGRPGRPAASRPRGRRGRQRPRAATSTAWPTASTTTARRARPRS